jgi:hypothetical protein
MNLGRLKPLSTNPDPLSSIPESGKGRGELKTRGDLPIKASQ